MNHYARLGDVKGDVTGLQAAVSAGTDESYLRDIADASRAFENDCNGRHFYAYRATRYFKGDGCPTLYLPYDLISVSSLAVDANGDGVAELTLVEGTDFWLKPDAAAQQGRPYWQLDLIPWGTQVYGWASGARGVSITGLWGWSYELESTGLTATVATTNGTSLTASANANALVYPGDTIVLDSEQMDVSAVSATAITVTRAINGTAAATHTSATLYVRRYPRDIEGVIKRRVLAKRWENRTGMPLGERTAGVDIQYATYMDVVKSYRDKTAWIGSF